jgi:hypothetical protein
MNTNSYDVGRKLAKWSIILGKTGIICLLISAAIEVSQMD